MLLPPPAIMADIAPDQEAEQDVNILVLLLVCCVFILVVLVRESTCLFPACGSPQVVSYPFVYVFYCCLLWLWHFLRFLFGLLCFLRLLSCRFFMFFIYFFIPCHKRCTHFVLSFSVPLCYFFTTCCSFICATFVWNLLL